jgi:hypothetical protein
MIWNNDEILWVFISSTYFSDVQFKTVWRCDANILAAWKNTESHKKYFAEVQPYISFRAADYCFKYNILNRKQPVEGGEIFIRLHPVVFIFHDLKLNVTTNLCYRTLVFVWTIYIYKTCFNHEQSSQVIYIAQFKSVCAVSANLWKQRNV